MTRLIGRLSTVLTFLSWHLQMCVTECDPAVLAERGNRPVPKGHSVSLSCDVQHCGQKNWTGGWGITRGEHFTLLNRSPRFDLFNQSLTVNKTRLLVSIHNINCSDSGQYQCRITFQSTSSFGHFTNINVTANISSGRNPSYRLLVCGAVTLCLCLHILAFCIFSFKRLAPPVPPHPRISSAARVKPTAEVMYAALVHEGLRRELRAPAAEPTVYSTLKSGH